MNEDTIQCTFFASCQIDFSYKAPLYFIIFTANLTDCLEVIVIKEGLCIVNAIVKVIMT